MPDINVILPDGSEKTYYGIESVTYDSANDPEKTETFIHETLMTEPYTHPDSHPASMITGLSRVATSGDYADLKGKIVGDITAVEEDDYEFTLNDGLHVHTFDEPLDIVKGESYKVMWDGTEHICECKDTFDTWSGFNISQLYLGNLYILAPIDSTPDTSEPFFISVDAGNILTNDNSATHKVGVYPVNDVIKLDHKYLPDNLATHEWVQEEIDKIDLDEFTKIPVHTASDEGKVLSVKDGELSWETVSGGADEDGGESGPSSDLLETIDTTLTLLHRNTTKFAYDSSFGLFMYAGSISEDQYRKWTTYNGLVSVHWDGETYTVPIQDVVFQGISLKAVGGLTMLGGTGTEPFMVTATIAAPGVYVAAVASFDTEAVEHTVQVTLSNAESKVDDKYLPDIPLFDLTAMGMPAFSNENSYAGLSIDTTAIRSAAHDGIVKFAIIYAGNVLEIPALFTRVPRFGTYVYSTIISVLGIVRIINFEIEEGTITINITPL